jgi:hypothetical protein
MSNFVDQNVSQYVPGAIIAPEYANAVIENLDSRACVRPKGGKLERSRPESRIRWFHDLGLDHFRRIVGARLAQLKLE